MRHRDPLWSAREEIAYRLRYFLNAYPAFYMPIVRWRHPERTDYAVSRDTDLVIEAFGRSGTTFANFAFLSAQIKDTKTAHHTHAAANVLTAVKWQIPTLVIVRQPVEVALSHMVRHKVSARAALKAWLRFHKRILPYRDRMVIASFAAATRDFGAVIRRVNQKFKTEFVVWEHSQTNEADIHARVRERAQVLFEDEPQVEIWRAVGLPTSERDAIKKRLEPKLLAPGLETLRSQTHDLYELLTRNEVIADRVLQELPA